MGWLKTNFDQVWVFEPTIWKDERGYFVETFNASGLPDDLRNITFVQDNEARSTKGVLRGLHYQLAPMAQSKLVRCVSGEVLDVIVDLRPDSATYGQHLSLVLNEINKKQLFVPHGFAHGYVVLSDTAIFAYKCDNYYSPAHEAGLLYNDENLQINWLLSGDSLIVSSKDIAQPDWSNHKPYM